MAGHGAGGRAFSAGDKEVQPASLIFPASPARSPFPLLLDGLGLFVVGTSESSLGFKSPMEGEGEFFQVAERLRPAV